VGITSVSNQNVDGKLCREIHKGVFVTLPPHHLIRDGGSIIYEFSRVELSWLDKFEETRMQSVFYFNEMLFYDDYFGHTNKNFFPRTLILNIPLSMV
jgi:hypothetical protein